MPQMSQVLRERAIGMLTAGMSTRAVARELNVHFSTISRLQRRFREFGSTSNRPHNRRPRVTTTSQDPPASKFVWDQPPGQMLATIGLHNQRISAQTVRNRLREAHLHARRPHRVVLHCMRQMVVTPDTDWFSDPPNTVKLHILEWPFIVASLRHNCAIIMLSNQHLDMPHLWGGWIISAKEKCSLTQI